jgi:hypothetical protein
VRSVRNDDFESPLHRKRYGQTLPRRALRFNVTDPIALQQEPGQNPEVTAAGKPSEATELRPNLKYDNCAGLCLKKQFLTKQ